MHCLVMRVWILVSGYVTVRYFRHGVLVREWFRSLIKVVVFVNVVLYFIYGLLELV